MSAKLSSHEIADVNQGSPGIEALKRSMARTWILAAAFILILSGCVSIPSEDSGGDSAREKTEVRNRLLQIFDAAEKKDMERLDGYHLYDSRFSKFSAGQFGRQDAKAAREGEHTGLGAIDGLTMAAENLKIDIFGDVAIATFILNYSYQFQGESNVGKERSTLVFVEDGVDWKIVHEHFSVVRNPEP